MNSEPSKRITNLSMLSDFYEFTMAQAYLKTGHRGARSGLRHVLPSGARAAATPSWRLVPMIDYLRHLRFGDDDLAYLKEQGFDDDFLDYLKNFEFACDVWRSPKEPRSSRASRSSGQGAPMQAQLIETMLLLSINHQSLIATKSARIVRSAKGRSIMEFGARRAQGADASLLGARAAYIGGVAGTSCTLSAQQFNIPALGTMAHSWVQSFPSEYEAFKAYAEVYPDNTQLLVDTYDVLRQGIPNAIRVAKEVLEPMGNAWSASASTRAI